MGAFVLFFSFLIKKQKQKEPQTHLSQEKTQDQRKLLLKYDFLKKGAVSASLLLYVIRFFPKIPVSFLSLHELGIVVEGGGWVGGRVDRGLKKGGKG